MCKSKIITKYVSGYLAKFEPCEEGGFTATVPSLNGCISEGDSFEEAQKNLEEAIELWLTEALHVVNEAYSKY